MNIYLMMIQMPEPFTRSQVKVMSDSKKEANIRTHLLIQKLPILKRYNGYKYLRREEI